MISLLYIVLSGSGFSPIDYKGQSIDKDRSDIMAKIYPTYM
jgi:hypothetical protein